MNKVKCKECNKSFEPQRANNIYCSKVCKQQAHHKRASAKVEPLAEGQPLAEKEVFYTKDFWNFRGKVQYETMTLIHFSFLLRLYKPKELTEKGIFSYMASFWTDESDYGNIFNISALKTSAYKDFEERFLSGEFEIKEERELSTQN